MARQYYALWKNRNGQRMWDGPFRTNTAAQQCLGRVTGPLNGSVITTTIPMTPGEAREAAMLDRPASLPAGRNINHEQEKER